MNDTDDMNHERLNECSGAVIAAAFAIHSELGPGLLESAYVACLCFELRSRGLHVRSQVKLPVVYKTIRLDVAYRLDLLVERSLIVEVKAVEKLHEVHEAQLLSYLKLSGLRLG